MKYRKAICDNCKEEYEVKQSDYLFKLSQHHFCCRKCYYEWRKDYRNCPRWKGGEAKMLGYVFIFKPEHPFANDVGYIKRSRYVMEQYLGRYLRPEEIIHHINEKRDDDRIENLRLCLSNSEHMQIGHSKAGRKSKQLVQVGV